MLAKQPLSELLRAAKLTSVLLSVTALFACGGSDPVTSSSASSVSSANSSSSAPVQASVRVQAQNYNAYNESDQTRQGATSGVCGSGMVDLVETPDQGGQCAVGYISAGEWVEYNLSGLQTGTYNMVLRIGSANAGRRVQVSVNGTSVGQVATTATGWEAYGDQTISSVRIPTSNPTLRFTFPDGEVNFNYFTLNPVSTSASSVSSVSSVSSSSVVSTSSSSSSSATGNAAAGATAFSAQCSTCHSHQGSGVFSALSTTFNVNTLLSQGGIANLTSIINGSMPLNNAGNCVGTCAANTAAYLATFAGSSSSVSSSNSSVNTSYVYSGFSHNMTNGQQQFNAMCSGCHDDLDSFSRNLKNYGSIDRIFRIVNDTMPRDQAYLCQGQCAADVTAYLNRLIEEIVVLSCDANAPVTYGVRGLRLLTAQEFKNSLEDLGIAQSGEITTDDLAQDDRVTRSSYPVHTKTIVNSLRMDIFSSAADRLASSAAARIRNGCSSTTQCADRFITLANRMFRRPLDSNETALYRGMFTEFGMNEGMEVALAAAITSPQFLYRSEVGVPASDARNNSAYGLQNVANVRNADTNSYVLDNYEFATALSYMYTGSTPDTSLMQAAANNQLNTEAQIDTQIERLLNTSRGQAHMGNFAGIWMRADDVLQASRPNHSVFTDQVKKDMAEEIRQLFRYVFYNADVPFEDFYGGDFAVLNRNLASFYGVNMSTSGWSPVQVPNRGGVITTGAFMAANADSEMSGPIKRAVDIRELMLCHHIDPPPDNLAADRQRLRDMITDEQNAGRLTSRRYFEVVTDAPACDACHETIINPLFGVEDFDQIGRFRSTMKGLGDNGVNGLAVDNYGELIGTDSAKGTDILSFYGSKDLGEQIASLPATRACLIVNAFRYTTGLAINSASIYRQKGIPAEPVLTSEQEADFSCAKSVLESEYVNSNSNVKEVFKKIGALELVRFRK